MFINFLLVGFLLSINNVISILAMPQLNFAPSFLLPQSRIIGGVQRNIRDIQFQISLWNGTKHFCGAALLNSKWAATAAHCLGKFKQTYARINSSDCTQGGQLIKVVKEHIHPLYDEIAYDYDFGLLELAPFNSTGLKFVRFKKCKQRKCGAEDIVEVSGWGVNNITDVKKKFKLQSVRLQIVNDRSCYNTFKSVFDVTDRMICAGHKDGGKDSCQGDSGGPVTCKGDFIAVVSAGFACAMPKTPGLYTSIDDDDIKKFIEEKTGIPDNCKEITTTPCTTTTTTTTTPCTTTTTTTTTTPATLVGNIIKTFLKL